MSRRITVFVLLLALLSVVLPVAAQDDPYVIGVSNGFVGSEWRTQMIQNIEAVVQEYNDNGIPVELVVESADTDVQGQVQQIQNLINRGVDAIIINPNDADEMVQALERAIVMPVDEQRNHMQRMQHMVKLYDIHNWVELFIDRLNYIYEKQKSYATKPLNETAVREISERYGKSAKSLFVFDLDETFVPSGEFPLPRRLDEETFQVIKELSEVEKNKVVCVTSTDSETAERWFDGLRVDLIAEHGIWNKSYGESWNALENISSEWKYDIFPVLEHFVKRTPGSFIEEKDFSLVWHYRKVETGLGEIRTRELSEHLKYLVSNMNLNVIEGNMTMEIKSSLINKGRAVRRWLEQNAPDFIFAFGSINTSEDIFKALPVNAFKVKLGRGHSTNANYHILKKDEIFDLFRMLAFTKAFNLN